ncbi:MAG: hypothetical protein LBL95_07050 [Deltaproteobacteria bacterium]|jgi:hypothetical protein|nr:hypothetical protein [Deltaproteobacteria bacterium]
MSMDKDNTNPPDGDLGLAPDSGLDQDLSLDAPDLEPSPAHSGPNLQMSQAVKDLESLDEAELSKPASLGDGPPASPGKAGPSPEARGYQWFFVHLLGLLGLIAWAAGAFLASLPYRWEAALIALAVAVLTIPTMRTFHVRTRAGLAGLGAALGLAVCSFYNPDAQFLPGVPLALVWLLILAITWLWLVVAVFRNESLRKSRLALALSIVLIYPLLAPVFAILNSFVFNSLPIESFDLHILNESPGFLSKSTPWLVWPQAFMAFLVPPLAAVFLIRDQIITYRISEPGQRHLGALWLSLAGFVVLVYSLLSFSPLAEDYPNLVSSIRNMWPAASQYHRSALVAQSPAVPTRPSSMPPAVPPVPGPEALTGPTQDGQPTTTVEAPSAETASAADAPALTVEPSSGSAGEPSAPHDAAAGPPASPEDAGEPSAPHDDAGEEAGPAAGPPASPEDAGEPSAPHDDAGEEADPAAGPPASPEDAGEPSAPHDDAGEEAGPAVGDEAAGHSEWPTAVQPIGTDEGPSPSDQDILAAMVPNGQSQPSTLTTPEFDEMEEIGPIIATSLEMGSGQAGFVPLGDERDSGAMAVLTQEAEGTLDTGLADKVEALAEENRALKDRILILEAQNELLLDRIKYYDGLISNIIVPR